MKHIKITILILVAFVLAIYSITSSYSALIGGEDGIALVKEESYQVDLILNNNITSSEIISFSGEPEIVDNEINFSIGLDEVGSFGQIYFDIDNKGDYDAILRDIEIQGLNEYQDYVDISLLGIEKGEVIENGTLVKNVSIKITYNNDYGNSINLDNIGVKFNIEKV